MVYYKIGNILNFTEDAFGHGCNCQGVMGAGLALSIKHRYPMLFRAFKEDNRKPKDKLGSFTLSSLSLNKLGYNLYTQLFYGGKATCYLDYRALETSLLAVCNSMIYFRAQTLALPRIGAGLAGGDWNKILPIIEKCSKNSGIDITIYSL